MSSDWRMKTFVEGYDRILEGGIPLSHIVLLAGTPGTMKSSVCYSILYQNSLINKQKSVYMTLEQSRESLLQQMHAMNMDRDESKEYVHILDLGLIRKSLTQLSAKGTWLQVFKMYAESLKHSLNYEMIVVDSLDVLEMAAQIGDNRRRSSSSCSSGSGTLASPPS